VTTTHWDGPELLPVGTQVVVRPAGRDRPAHAVGVIVARPVDPQHAYRVRFPDGTEGGFRRTDLAVRKRVQAAAVGEAGPVDLRAHVIYRCVVGSRAYGLDRDDSDVDRRGVYLPPAELHWSLAGVPDQLEDPAADECYWELRKFLVLACKANPNVLECLWTPLVELATPLAEELRAMRDAFLSRLIYQTYNGYVLSQFRRFERARRNQGAIKWKHAMHLVRLLLAGVIALRESEIPVAVGAERERLLAIRDGAMPWDEIEAWRLALHRELDAALASSPLPDRPDYRRVDAFLVRARRLAAEGRAWPTA